MSKKEYYNKDKIESNELPIIDYEYKENKLKELKAEYESTTTDDYKRRDELDGEIHELEISLGKV